MARSETPKTPRDVRLCFIGDSFVNGTIDEAYLGWCGRVSVRLRAHGLDLTTYNLGIRRDTSADIRARWRAEAGRRLPDHVSGRLVFAFGINDCVEQAGQRRVALADTLENAHRILSEAAAWKPTICIGPPPLSRTDQSAINERIRSVSEGLRDTCTSLPIPYVDLFDQLVHEPAWEREIALGDGTHPGGAGYERIAAIVLAAPAWNAWLADSDTN